MLALFVAWAVVLGGLASVDANPAHAQSAQDEEKGKEYWQERYRGLLRRAAQARHDNTIAMESYKRAKRRNYPRGSARDRFLSQAEEAERELATVEKEIATFRSDARQQGALPGWLYEVEEEPFELAPAAAPPSDTSDETRVDREGRNPLYFKDDDAS